VHAEHGLGHSVLALAEDTVGLDMAQPLGLGPQHRDLGNAEEFRKNQKAVTRIGVALLLAKLHGPILHSPNGRREKSRALWTRRPIDTMMNYIGTNHTGMHHLGSGFTVFPRRRGDIGHGNPGRIA
jgi:hypothetical protein